MRFSQPRVSSFWLPAEKSLSKSTGNDNVFSHIAPQTHDGDDTSLSLLLNFENRGVDRGLVRTSTACSEIVTEDRRRYSAWLLAFEEEILDPLNLRERMRECPKFYFGGATADSGLFRVFPRDQIRAEEDAITCGGSAIVRITSLIEI
ncbi:hypothetical protein PIB30_084700 [Stylosanthes scabra]|uniref:Uncharacterized protein n=1 Tax=Stylosanthes scabra TaxID=79078 RepID=A0ABU6ZR86_9FABA|nr:hypothetical protein [Stylosanthes scabra]